MCGICAAMSIVCLRLASASMNSGKLSQSHCRPASRTLRGISSTFSMISMSQDRASGRTGAKPTPQLPITSDVTPCQAEGASTGSHIACAS
jgi:hypothetical protein